MKSLLTCLHIWTILGLLSACQTKPLPEPVSTVDSLVSVQFPDVRAVAARSITPRGALDQLIRKSSIRYSVDSDIYSDSVRTQFLYNASGQLVGYQNFSLGQVISLKSEQEQLEQQASYGVVYEYQHNRPYRIYMKSYSSELTPRRDLFFMTELVYPDTSATRPVFKRDYGVSATGQASLLAQYELVYDQEGNLTESKDVKGYFVHQRFTYKAGNVIKEETIDPKSLTQRGYTEYDYDKTRNPTKNFFWSGNYDYTVFTANTNNVVQKRDIDSSPGSKPAIQKYTLEYDKQSRLIRRTILINNSLMDIGRTDWLYRYAQ